MAWTGRLLQRQCGANGLDILRIGIDGGGAQARPGWLAEMESVTCPLMRSSPGEDWVEILAPADAWRWPVDTIRTLTPVSRHALTITTKHPFILAVGEGLGLAPVVFLSDLLRRNTNLQGTVFLGDRQGFPFQPAPSRIIVPHLPSHLIATLPLLEDWHIACRLALAGESPGCHQGPVCELAATWLAGDKARLPHVMVYASGGDGFCDRMNRLCRQHSVACQLMPLA